MYFKVALSILLLCVFGLVFADSIDSLRYSVGFSYENSNNINLSSTNKKSENIIHSLFNIVYNKQTSVININLNLNADYTDYQKNVYPDQLAVTSNLVAASTLVKNRLFWDLSNRSGRVQSKYNAVNIPTNQENTNYFETGPRLVLFQNAKESLNAKALYQRFYAQTSNSDYSGNIFNAKYNRNITRTFSIGLEVNFNDKKFDDNISNTDYSRTDATVQFKKRLRLSEAAVTVGNTQIDSSNSTNTNFDRHNIFRAEYNYNQEGRFGLNLNYRKELGDFAGVFSGGNAPGSNLPIVGSALFVLEQAQLQITKKFATTSLAYGYTYYSNDYQDVTLDLVSNTSQVTLSQELGTNLNLTLNGIYVRSKYPGLNRVDTDRVYMTGLTKSFLNKYDITLNIRYDVRGSTDSLFAYNERRISLGGHYYFR